MSYPLLGLGLSKPLSPVRAAAQPMFVCVSTWSALRMEIL